jgi:UDPglucose 6-dehydrogenase
MTIKKSALLRSIITSLFNTVSGKKITLLGWAFKKDTNDTRESAAIYIADHLIENQAEIHVYDPKVSEEQIKNDMQYLWSQKGYSKDLINNLLEQINVYNDPYIAMDTAHAIAVITEWDEFKLYDWDKVYKSAHKPAFIFDGRNILDKDELSKIGFNHKGVGI